MFTVHTRPWVKCQTLLRHHDLLPADSLATNCSLAYPRLGRVCTTMLICPNFLPQKQPQGWMQFNVHRAPPMSRPWARPGRADTSHHIPPPHSCTCSSHCLEIASPLLPWLKPHNSCVSSKIFFVLVFSTDYFLEHVQVHSKIEQKGEKFSTPSCPPPHTASPITNSLH